MALVLLRLLNSLSDPASIDEEYVCLATEVRRCLFGSIVPLLCSGRGVIGNDERAELNLRQVLN